MKKYVVELRDEEREELKGIVEKEGDGWSDGVIAEEVEWCERMVAKFGYGLL